MLTILLFVACIALVVWGARNLARNESVSGNDGEINAMVIGGIGIVVLSMLLMLARISNEVGNANLSLAYSTTIQNYKTTEEMTKGLISLPGQANGVLVAGSVEKLQIASAAATRMTELRDKINAYNEIIVTKEAWSHEWLLGGFLWTPPPPKNIVPYTMKDGGTN